jgi:hypothetical protein
MNHLAPQVPASPKASTSNYGSPAQPAAVHPPGPVVVDEGGVCSVGTQRTAPSAVVPGRVPAAAGSHTVIAVHRVATTATLHDVPSRRKAGQVGTQRMQIAAAPRSSASGSASSRHARRAMVAELFAAARGCDDQRCPRPARMHRSNSFTGLFDPRHKRNCIESDALAITFK